MSSNDLVSRLQSEPELVAAQLRAMAEISDFARQMHRFDEYLLAAANHIDHITTLEGALRRIAEGNLGDRSWQANYDRIREVARAALLKASERTEAADHIIATLEAEVERLKEKCDRQAMILRRLNPEKHPDTFFICGESGNKDDNGLPDGVLVCPAYGCDWSVLYRKTDDGVHPEW